MKISVRLDKDGKGLERPAFLIPASFLLPFALILVALLGMHVTPFGDKTLVISDANGLYINTLAYAGRMFRGLENALYSFEKGLGGNMTGHFNGVLLTPFSFLFSLSDAANYPTAFTFVSTAAFSLCGLTMYFLMADIYGHKRSNLIFSTTYALIGFNVANVFQACFFMAAPALPLMALGLRKIFAGKSPLLYILTIAYALLTSFFFGFVLCVASVLFFFTNLWLHADELRGRKLRIFVHYAIASILGGLLPIAFWLSGFLSLRGGRLEQTKLADFSFWENMPFLEIGAKLFTGANSTAELVNGLPNVYVGILPLALAVLFFLCGKIGKRKKAAAGFLLGFYLLSFWFSALNMLMHGGTTTNWFNYRYSYVFSFLLLLLAAETWQKLDELTGADMKRCLIGMLLAAAVIFTKKYEFVKGGAVLLDFVLLLLIFLAWRIHKKRPEANPRKLFEIIALVLVCVNLFLNYRICTMNIMEWGQTLSEYQKVVTQVDPLVHGIQTADDGFYRMEVNRQRSGTCGNDPMLYGYNGVGHGGSNERDFVRTGLSKLGVPWFNMRSYYADGVPAATDTLLGIKYVIAAEDLTEEKSYRNMTNLEQLKPFGEQEEYWDFYYNADALSVAMLSTPEIRDVKTVTADVFENLNAVWSALSGEDRAVFVAENDIRFTVHNLSDPVSLSAQEAREITAYYDAKQSSSDSTAPELSAPDGVLEDVPQGYSYIEYSFTAARDGAVYAFNKAALLDTNGSAEPTLRFVGNYHAGDEVVGRIPVGTAYVDQIVMEEYCGRFRAAYADMDALHELSETVKARPVTIEKEKETHLTGTFTAETAQTLLFTIPYDAGWSCRIDGEKAELYMVLDVLTAVDVPAGEHSFEMTYVPEGFRPGLLVSACALVLILVYLPLGKKWIDRGFEKRSAALQTNAEQTPEEQTTEENTPTEGEEKKDDPV